MAKRGRLRKRPLPIEQPPARPATAPNIGRVLSFLDLSA